MWLGWDHCGYDSISDEVEELENSTWRPPSSGRPERAHLLGPVGLPSDVINRDVNHRDVNHRAGGGQQQNQQR
ncbi:unnamed protein product, partial [Laminaria digitata]